MGRFGTKAPKLTSLQAEYSCPATRAINRKADSTSNAGRVIPAGGLNGPGWPFNRSLAFRSLSFHRFFSSPEPRALDGLRLGFIYRVKVWRRVGLGRTGNKTPAQHALAGETRLTKRCIISVIV